MYLIVSLLNIRKQHKLGLMSFLKEYNQVLGKKKNITKKTKAKM